MLSHPNVLKLVGVHGDMDKGHFITVSEWMAHGNIMQFIGKNPVNRLELVRGFTDSTPFTKMPQIVAWGSSGPKVPPRRQDHTREPQRGQRLFVSRQITLSDIQQASILMSNDNPPRACLADFCLMTMDLGPTRPMTCGLLFESKNTMFMSPELLVPGKFGITELGPTPEADIYAFGLVIYQVC
jgi:hypothetical protein